MRTSIVTFLMLLAATPSVALAQAAPAQTTATAYSVENTTIGTLLADPAAKAILEKHLPAFMSSGRADSAGGLTLKALQQYAPDMFTDKALADIQADLSKLPAK